MGLISFVQDSKGYTEKPCLEKKKNKKKKWKKKRILFSSVLHFCWVIWLLYNFLSSIYILDILLLSDIELIKIFSYCEVFSFLRSHLWNIDCTVLSHWFTVQEIVSSTNVYRAIFHFPLLDLVYPILCWGLWSTWTWVLCRAINMNLFEFFYMQASSQTSNTFWICFSLFYCMVLASLSKIKCQ